MPVSEMIIGHGKNVRYANDNATLPSSGWTDVAHSIDVSLPERELSAAEVTNDDSPDFHREYIVGLYDPGTASFSYRYTGPVFAALETIFQAASDSTRSDAYRWWQFELSDGKKYSFRGFITAHNLPVEGAEESPVVEVEIQVIGKMSVT